MAAIHMDNRERRVTITRTKLLDALRKNRKEHERIYNEALQGFETELNEALQGFKLRLDEYIDGLNLETAPGRIKEYNWRTFTKSLNLTPPENYLKAYDEAIKIFEWEERDLVELTVSEVLKFCEDQWSWQEAYLSSSARWSGTARVKMSQ